MKVPENAREQLRATLKSMDMQPDKHWVDVPRWAVPLVLAYLDIQDAASEAVTEEMVDQAQYASEDDYEGFSPMRAAIEAVAPALLLAGERRGLEKAAAYLDAEADDLAAMGDPDGAVYSIAAVEVRALGRPA